MPVSDVMIARVCCDMFDMACDASPCATITR